MQQDDPRVEKSEQMNQPGDEAYRPKEQFRASRGVCEKSDFCIVNMIEDRVQHSVDLAAARVSNDRLWLQAEVPKCADLRPVLALKPTSASRR